MMTLRSLPRVILIGLSAVSIVGVTACASTPKMVVSPNAGTFPPAATDGIYRLGLGDKVRINVFGEPSLSGEFQVSGNGAVTMPLVGDVPAVGKTARELEAALIEHYAAGYLKDPKIAVEVYDFRPYFVLGEVAKPGRYPAADSATLLGAIATAGGFTYRANRKHIMLRHSGEATEQSVDANADIHIQPGDVIRVGERYF